ncbi:hypothetical protein LXL04_019687 [Taraxacum kok-saghyz]
MSIAYNCLGKEQPSGVFIARSIRLARFTSRHQKPPLEKTAKQNRTKYYISLLGFRIQYPKPMKEDLRHYRLWKGLFSTNYRISAISLQFWCIQRTNGYRLLLYCRTTGKGCCGYRGPSRSTFFSLEFYV